jgi:hypothetical protein
MLQKWFSFINRTADNFLYDKYKPYDKAGAYGIQDWIGVVGIKSIHGDFYNVMGLPVSRVVQALAQFSNLEHDGKSCFNSSGSSSILTPGTKYCKWRTMRLYIPGLINHIRVLILQKQE